MCHRIVASADARFGHRRSHWGCSHRWRPSRSPSASVASNAEDLCLTGRFVDADGRWHGLVDQIAAVIPRRWRSPGCAPTWKARSASTLRLAIRPSVGISRRGCDASCRRWSSSTSTSS
jgi:hypothetical protein